MLHGWYHEELPISLFPGQGPNVPAVYAVDSTSPQDWTSDVYTPASQLIEAVVEVRTPCHLCQGRIQEVLKWGRTPPPCERGKN